MTPPINILARALDAEVLAWGEEFFSFSSQNFSLEGVL